jgi:predicted ribosome quality control (RQC) complex YloA/Tae2 family protein
MAQTATGEPKLLKKNISNVDLFVLANEMNVVLQDGFITNVYEITDTDLLFFKCRTKDGKKNIVIDLKKRLNLTDYEYPIPAFPSQFITSLRKFIKGRRIEQIYQYNMDRILVIQLRSSEGDPWKFIVELFGTGNFILIDGENRIIMAKHYLKKGEREILPKRIYQFPSEKGIDLKSLTKENFFQTMKDGNGDIVRFLARNFNMGGYLSEEICLQAKIDKTTEIKTISEQKLNEIYGIIENFTNILKNQQFSPRILFNQEKNPISFEPLAYELYKDIPFEIKPTFNIAVDEFFSKADSEQIYSKDVKEKKEQLSKTEKIFESQKAKIQESIEVREESIEKANIIFQYIPQIDSLINTIMTQKRDKKRDWDQIADILKKGKEKQIEECLIFEKFFPKEVMVEVNLEGNRFKLDLLKSAIDNANLLYDKAKKAKRKIVGAEKALVETQAKLEREIELHQNAAEAKKILIRKPPQKWYEKFRWFISSDGFLVIGGRDASSNEVLVKKYMRPNDLFFHTTARGAPVCIIQNEEKLPIPDLTLRETANFDASYSAGWKHGWGNSDVYYVYPDQVSKTPKAGEYLTKGSFYITGKKNLVPNPYLEVAIGVILEPIGEFDHLHEEEDEIQFKSSEPEIEEDLKSKEQRQKDSDKNQEGFIIEPNEEPENVELIESDQSEENVSENTQNTIEINSTITSNSKSNQNNQTGAENEINDEIQYYPKIISGPVSAIKKQTINFVILKPTKSKTSTSDVAKKILKRLENQAKEEEKKWVKLASVNDVIRLIPPGDSEIVLK